MSTSRNASKTRQFIGGATKPPAPLNVRILLGSKPIGVRNLHASGSELVSRTWSL